RLSSVKIGKTDKYFGGRLPDRKPLGKGTNRARTCLPGRAPRAAARHPRNLVAVHRPRRSERPRPGGKHERQPPVGSGIPAPGRSPGPTGTCPQNGEPAGSGGAGRSGEAAARG